MEITTKTIIFAVISLILIAAILGGVYYLLKNAKQLNLNKDAATVLKLQTIGASPTPILPVITAASTAENNTFSENTNSVPAVSGENNKTYQGQSFVLKYPTNWGIVTCNNSKNIEFDPYNKNDLINYSCDNAIKPITVLVSNQPVSCAGDNVKIGNNNVVRSKTETANWIKNRWCLNKGGVSLDITNRVAPTGITGTSKDDFSIQIEQIISSL